MNNTTHRDIPTLDGAVPAQNSQVHLEDSSDGPKKHFDTFETNFFQEGEDSANIPVEVDQFDDLDGTKRHFFSRQTLSGVAVVSTCAAILACIALWRSNSRAAALASASGISAAASPAHAATAVSPPAPAAVAPEPAQIELTPTQENAIPAAMAAAVPVPTSEAAAVHAEPVLNPPVAAQTEPTLAAQAEIPPAAAPAPAAPAPPVLAKSGATPAAMPTNAETPPEPAHPAIAEQPSHRGPDKIAAEAASTTQPDAADARSRCKKAIGGRHNKEILELCPSVFTSDPNASDIAVALAKIEFDRGRSAQAYAWSKKAIAANPDIADAYVFIGEAEQSAGHGKAAKEAYAHYLRLAPSGRYATDLRAIVNSL
jgi:tetratricopeptide (TPR) repeat protein